MTVAIVKKRRWKNKGVDVFERNVVSPLLEHDEVEAIEYDRADVYQTPEHHWLLGYVGRFKRGRQIVKAIRNDDYDKVFLPFQELLTFDPSKVDSQIIPYVHDVFPATTTFAGPIPTFLARQYVQNLMKCELVLCASKQTKRDLCYRTPFNNQAEVVYQGIDSPGVVSEVECKYDLLYIGSFLKRKNPSLLRQCMEYTTDEGYDCIVVLGEHAAENDLPCETRSNVSPDELWKLYAKSRFYLHPSKQEGFGRPPIEAQSIGTPPIALDIPINNEVLGHQGDSWISMSVPEDVIDIFQITSPRYKSLSKAAVKNSQRFDWESSIERIMGFLFYR